MTLQLFLGKDAYAPGETITGHINYLRTPPTDVQKVTIDIWGVSAVSAGPENGPPFLASDVFLFRKSTVVRETTRFLQKKNVLDFQVELPGKGQNIEEFRYSTEPFSSAQFQRLPQTFRSLSNNKSASISYSLRVSVFPPENELNRQILTQTREFVLEVACKDADIVKQLNNGTETIIRQLITHAGSSRDFSVKLATPHAIAIGHPVSLFIGYEQNLFTAPSSVPFLTIKSNQVQLQVNTSIQGLDTRNTTPGGTLEKDSWKETLSLFNRKNLDIHVPSRLNLGQELNLILSKEKAPLASLNSFNIARSYMIRFKVALSCRGAQEVEVYSKGAPVTVYSSHPSDVAQQSGLSTQPTEPFTHLSKAYAGMHIGRSGAPGPETHPKEYTAEKVKERLAFFEAHKKRDLTPRSKLFTDLYIQTSRAALAAKVSSERNQIYEKIHTYDTFIQRNSFLCQEPSQGQHDLEKKLMRLKHMEYLVRYGDYLAFSVREMKEHAINARTDFNEFLQGQYWTTIRDSLKEELEIRTIPNHTAQDIPTIMAIERACRSIGTHNADRMIWAIQTYADRNMMAHSGIEEHLQKAAFNKIAEILHQDEKDLPLIIPLDLESQLNDMLALIQEMKNRWFIIRPGFEDNPWSWKQSGKADKIFDEIIERKKIKDQAQLRVEQQAAIEAERTALAAKVLARAIDRTQLKRKPSREIPQGEENMTKERRQAIEKIVGLGNAVMSKEDELRLLYKTRDEAMKRLF